MSIPQGHFPRTSRGPWSDVPDREWNSWIWQQQNRLRSLSDFKSYFVLSEAERQAFAACARKFEAAVTSYYASLADPADPNCPIRRQALPAPEELEIRPEDHVDPLAEEAQSPVPGLVHRYPDRVLLYTNHNCPVYCRHCTRKRKVGDPGSAPHKTDLERAYVYIRSVPGIREVILSGGDPLSLSDSRLAEVLDSLYAIPHVQIVRIGTRNLVTLPQRIDEDLARLLGSYPAVQIMTHFNHPKECSAEARAASLRLAMQGVPIFNQMVFLRGINDDAGTVRELNHRLQLMRIRPHYMFHCDPSEGISHFKTSLKGDLEILRKLEGWTGSLAVPFYAIDLPGGGGKVRLSGQFQIKGDRLILTDYQGNIHEIPC